MKIKNIWKAIAPVLLVILALTGCAAGTKASNQETGGKIAQDKMAATSAPDKAGTGGMADVEKEKC